MNEIKSPNKSHFKKIWRPVYFLMLIITTSLLSFIYTFANNNPNPSLTDKYFGFNYSGAEFGDQNLPGTLGTDYLYPKNIETFRLLNSKGLTVIRIPFKWERLQRQTGEDLNKEDVEELAQMLVAAETVGSKVILDMHNFGRYYGSPMKSDKDIEDFSDVWRKIAAKFKDYPALLGYELMNEPHDLPGGSNFWKEASQKAVLAIRNEDMEHYIFASGYDWQSSQRWIESNNDFILSDPAKKIIYSAHCYFDKDGSGRYESSPEESDIAPSAIGNKINPFLDWLKENNVYGFISEFGVPNNSPKWQEAEENFLAILDANQNIAGATAWSAGPWWGEYGLSLEPDGDKNKLLVLEKFPTVINANLKTKNTALPSYLKNGVTVKIGSNPTIYLVQGKFLYPFSNFESYSLYIKQNKARLYFLRKANYSIKMRFAEDLLYFNTNRR